MTVSYTHNTEAPELIELCIHCTRPDCDGLCDDYCDRYRALNGLPPRAKHSHGIGRPHMPRKRYDGFGEVLSITEWSRRSGITYQALWYRLVVLGMDVETALSVPRMRNHNSARYTIGGEQLTVLEISRKYNVPRSTLYAHLTKGMTPEDAIDRIRKMRRYKHA